MKKVCLMFLLCLSLSCLFAQKSSYGISLGINYNQLKIEEDLSLSNQIQSIVNESRPGFEFGIHAAYKLSDRLILSPQALLRFSENTIAVVSNNDQATDFILEQVYVNIPVDLQFALLKNDPSLYLLGGAAYNFNIANDVEEPKVLLKQGFFSGRIGFGLRKNFSRFSISPELIFSSSLANVENDLGTDISQVITKLDSNVLSLRIKFQGLLD